MSPAKLDKFCFWQIARSTNTCWLLFQQENLLIILLAYSVINTNTQIQLAVRVNTNPYICVWVVAAGFEPATSETKFSALPLSYATLLRSAFILSLQQTFYDSWAGVTKQGWQSQSVVKYLTTLLSLFRDTNTKLSNKFMAYKSRLRYTWVMFTNHGTATNVLKWFFHWK